MKRMSLERAQKIVETIIAAHKRWGRAAGTAQESTSDVVEALVVIDEYANLDGPTKADMTTANRRLAAANAREQGYKKRIEDLEQELAEWKKGVDVYSARVTEAIAFLDSNTEHDEDDRALVSADAVRQLLRPVPEREIKEAAGE